VPEGPVSPWGANETTTPAGPAFEAARESPLNLPAVMTNEPSETFEPGKSPASLEARKPLPQPVLPNRPIIAPLPAALKNKAPPQTMDETGKTKQRGGGFIWVIIPLIAVLGVAAFVLYDVYQQEIEKRIDEKNDKRPMGLPSSTDVKTREVPANPVPVEAETTTPTDEPEALVPTEPSDKKDPDPAPAPGPAPEAAAPPGPAPAPTAAPPPTAAPDELAPLKTQPPPKAVKKKQRQR
jgi:hypothetical protein